MSKNYQKIAEGFNLALAEISSDLRYIRRTSRISDSPEIKQTIVTLYVQVFQFLCYAMNFYHSRKSRIKASFNQNFYNDEVKKMVSEMQLSVQHIRRESELIAQARIENTEVQVSKLTEHLLDLQVVGGESWRDDFRAMRAKLDSLCNRLDDAGYGSLRRTIESSNQEFGTYPGYHNKVISTLTNV